MAGMTASCGTNDLILIKARSVVQVHPGPPSNHINKYAATFTFPGPGISSQKAICQKFAKSSVRLTLPAFRGVEWAFRSLRTSSSHRYEE
jgi:hypothetical protein